MSDAVAAWLQEHGLHVDLVALDGEIHRVDGSKRGRGDGWYIGWADPVEVCMAGDWALGEQWTHKRFPRGATLAEQKLVKKRLKEAAEKAELLRQARRRSVAIDAQATLSRAQRADIHPYLAAKGVKSHGVFALDGDLLIPNRDADGFVWGYQIISATGKKLWLREQRTGGTFFQIGELGTHAYICEGYATGATIFELTGEAVFCAFSATNLMSASKSLKATHPEVVWTIASDNDTKTAGNPGLRHATKASEAIGARLIYPAFDSNSKGTDFNDLLKERGEDAVRSQLQGGPMAAVASIAEERQKRGKGPSEENLSPAELHQLIVRRMQGDGVPFDWPAFPRRFHVVADAAGRKAVLEELEGEIVHHRDKQLVADTILKYAHAHVVMGGEMAARHAAACRDLWLGLTAPLPETPTPFLDRNTEGLTFKRLEFDTTPGWDGTEPPLFEEFLHRCSNWRAVCAFIGSLFFPQADRQQYLYLYGPGGDGKGAIMRLLHRVFGDSAQALEPRERGDRFWNMKVYRKRLGLFFDCEDMRWFSSPTFKSLLGNDPLYFEAKGEQGFTDIPVCKVIVASNSRPQISGQRSDLRRLIYVNVDPSPIINDPTYEPRLALETEAIIRTCKAIYLEDCPTFGAVPFDFADDVALEAEASFLDVFHKHFVKEEGATVMGEDVKSVLGTSGIRSTQQMKALKGCWERRLKIAIRHTGTGTVYEGVRLKSKRRSSRKSRTRHATGHKKYQSPYKDTDE